MLEVGIAHALNGCGRVAGELVQVLQHFVAPSHTERMNSSYVEEQSWGCQLKEVNKQELLTHTTILGRWRMRYTILLLETW